MNTTIRVSLIKSNWKRRAVIAATFPLLAGLTLILAALTGIALCCLCIYAWFESTLVMLRSAGKVW